MTLYSDVSPALVAGHPPQEQLKRVKCVWVVTAGVGNLLCAYHVWCVRTHHVAGQRLPGDALVVFVCIFVSLIDSRSRV